jgi:hypothetical protein
MGDVIHMHEPRDLLLDDARTKNIVFLKLQNTLGLLGESSKRVTLLPNLVEVILVRKKERKKERKINLHQKITPV